MEQRDVTDFKRTIVERADILFVGYFSFIYTHGQLIIIINSTTVGINIVNWTFAMSTSLPPLYRDMLHPLSVSLDNVMACRVFRMLQLGHERAFINTVIQDSRDSEGRSSQRIAANSNPTRNPIFHLERYPESGERGFRSDYELDKVGSVYMENGPPSV
jgi:hypothetical protein